ncbi:SHOCT domain-containing protein [Glycomyces xiaoerkulensis]|uniref:SHOCT domain-containing protein n=1 Tax=Glycomyces xiaoerkulensis TaxID=2038139 RepID=UPI0018E4960E|nr:SHOCT domain-containing protein [Glycomyces xiaoerkulensis]
MSHDGDEAARIAAAALILFGIFGMAIMGASSQAFCPNFGFGADRCWRIRNSNIALGRGLLIGAGAFLLLLLIVIFASGIGKQVPKTDYRHRDDEMVRRIAELAALHDQGVLSDEEFESAKRRLLVEPGSG